MNNHEFNKEKMKHDSIGPGAVRLVTNHLGFDFAYESRESF